MVEEKEFDKYRRRGNIHWREMVSKDPRVFNAYSQARYEWILKLAGEIRGKRVLDLGCGDGSLSYLLDKAGAKLTGVDNNEVGLNFAREHTPRAEFINASVSELPFESENFDAVVSCEVIEHLTEPEKMLREAKRVLKSGGKIVLTTPYRLTEKPVDPNHIKEFYPEELKSLLGKYFSRAEVKSTHHLVWRGLYTYSVRSFGNRALGRWLINSLTLLVGWNPFLIDYANSPAKFDLFGNLSAWAYKE